MDTHYQHLIIFLLAVGLFLAVCQIILSGHEDQVEESFKEGTQLGYEQALTQVYAQSSTCQLVPIQTGNNTINLIAIECLQTQEEE